MVDLLTGYNINGYQVGTLIAKGGMGEVYQGINAHLETIAIKILRTDDPTMLPEWTERFVREVRLMEALNHPHIVPIHDYGFYNGLLYFTMKYIEGPTLTHLLKELSFTPASMWQILQQVAQGVAYGHQQGVIHRDIKPDNILLQGEVEQWQAYIVDFGIGKKPGVDNTLTEEGSILGTPAYMSPEAVLGERMDYRADIYSLGAIAYEMLLGIPTFKEAHAHLTAMAQVTKPLILPRQHRPDFPPSLEAVLVQALAKGREKRYQSVTELIQAFETALDQLDEAELTQCYGV